MKALAKPMACECGNCRATYHLEPHEPATFTCEACGLDTPICCGGPPCDDEGRDHCNVCWCRRRAWVGRALLTARQRYGGRLGAVFSHWQRMYFAGAR